MRFQSDAARCPGDEGNLGFHVGSPMTPGRGARFEHIGCEPRARYTAGITSVPNAFATICHPCSGIFKNAR